MCTLTDYIFLGTCGCGVSKRWSPACTNFAGSVCHLRLTSLHSDQAGCLIFNDIIPFAVQLTSIHATTSLQLSGLPFDCYYLYADLTYTLSLCRLVCLQQSLPCNHDLFPIKSCRKDFLVQAHRFTPDLPTYLVRLLHHHHLPPLLLSISPPFHPPKPPSPSS